MMARGHKGKIKKAADGEKPFKMETAARTERQ
jgi:hypothetical protein